MFSFKTTKTTPEEPEMNFDDYKVSASEFLQKLRTAQEQAFVFDLRTVEAFEKGNFYTSHSLPFEYLEESIYRMPYSGDIYFYGDSEEIGRKAIEQMYENGFEDVHYLESYSSLVNELKQASFTIDDRAYAYIQKQLTQDNSLKCLFSAIPVSLKHAQFEVSLKKDVPANVETLQIDDITVFLTPESLLFLEGSRLVLQDSKAEPQLSVVNSVFVVPPLPENAEDVLTEVIENHINPMVAQHSGYVNFVGLDNARAVLEFGGGCKGCSGVSATLKYGVTNAIQKHLPGIIEVLDVTDHANGTNPYFTG